MRHFLPDGIGFTYSFAIITFQILFYAVRPGFVRSQRLTLWHFLNFVSQIFFDVLIVSTMGYQALLYMLASSFFAGSLHPCAGHFIAEHYLWDGLDQETYSYYGPLNLLAYNVGVGRPDVNLIADNIIRLATIMSTTTSLPSHGHDSLNCVRWSPKFTTISHPILHGLWSSLTSYLIRTSACPPD